MWGTDLEMYDLVEVPKANSKIYVNKSISLDFIYELEDFLLISSMMGYDIRSNEDIYANIRYGIYAKDESYVLSIPLSTRRIVGSVSVSSNCLTFKERMKTQNFTNKIKLLGNSYWESTNNQSRVELIKVLKEHLMNM